MKILQTDCLVIGYGLAGAAYALMAARNGLRVTVLSSEAPPAGANSDWAQGGIIFHQEADMTQLKEDIIRASDFTANPEAVETLARFGPETVRDFLIQDLNVPFDTEESGALKYTREGGHSTKRIIFSKDTTGHSILTQAHKAVEMEPNITLVSNAMAIDLLTLSHNSLDPLDKYKPLTCFGTYYLDLETGETVAVIAKKTILATGGAGQVYLHTTNQESAVGGGIAMAYRVGARVIDMEYVQFHPTAFAKKNCPAFLISEAVRGEGGVLVNADGQAFMEGKHELAHLAPRDIVARGIHEEMALRGDHCVYLDLSSRDPGFMKDRFPYIYQRCLDNGVDFTHEPIPVSPAAHYLCGGIHTDMRGRTNIRHLNAIGECACTGLHGANRLASTSLLECIVGARLTADADAREIAEVQFFLPDVRPWRSPMAKASTTLINQDFTLIRNTMWNYVGLVRSHHRLERARRILKELKAEVNQFYAGYRLNRPLLVLRNALQTAQMIVYAAALNPVSKGSHYVTSDTEEPPKAPVTQKV
jgi:L-aspartate oxidase